MKSTVLKLPSSNMGKHVVLCGPLVGIQMERDMVCDASSAVCTSYTVLRRPLVYVCSARAGTQCAALQPQLCICCRYPFCLHPVEMEMPIAFWKNWIPAHTLYRLIKLEC
jgi:hypothetical protein